MKKISFLTLLVILLGSCAPSEELSIPREKTTLIIWDAENVLKNYPRITADLRKKFPSLTIFSRSHYEDTLAPLMRQALSAIPRDGSLIFLVASRNPQFHIGQEWNLWMPRLWRELECRAKILIVDAPWGEEFANPLKFPGENKKWIIEGVLGNLQKKLPDSLLVTSSRYNEINLVSKGIDGKSKTPLFFYYFLKGLTEKDAPLSLLSLIEETREKTVSARKRGVVSDLEEVFFFQKSDIAKEEFLSYPHPRKWNGLSRKIILEEAL